MAGGPAAPVANGNTAVQATVSAACPLPSIAPVNQAPVQGASNGEAQDPWNALDVQWDSDTPPGWPRLVCPWQVRVALSPLSLVQVLAYTGLKALVFKSELKPNCILQSYACKPAFYLQRRAWLHASLTHLVLLSDASPQLSVQNPKRQKRLLITVCSGC